MLLLKLNPYTIEVIIGITIVSSCFFLVLFIFMALFSRFFGKRIRRKSQKETASPIFEWPDLLFQEKVNRFESKENILPLPTHEVSSGMRLFVLALIVLIIFISAIQPYFIVDGYYFKFLFIN